jgi:lipopolysaccharide export system permease protein
VLIAFMNLNRTSELIALRAAGVSAWRFVMPAAAAAAVIGLLAMTVVNPVASEMSATYERLRSQSLDGPAGSSKPIWLRQGDRRRQTIIQARANQPPGVHLKDVTLYVYSVAPEGQLKLAELIKAKDAILRHHIWSMTDVSSFEPGGLGVTTHGLEIPSDLSEHTALERFGSASGVPFWSLPGAIARTEAAGISATAYRLQFQQLLATPLMYAAMSVLAAAFSLRLLRLGGIAQFAGSGISLGFAFFFFNQFCSSLGKSDVLPPIVAAWTPPVMALLVGITLLCYTEDG